MTDITLGQRGCLNADLELAQSQAFAAEIVHQDPDGHVIDHSEDECFCRLQREGFDDVVLDRYVSASPDKVTIAIPGRITATIAAGSYKWDLFVGEVRLLYGKAKVYDTYSRDTDG